MTKTQPASASAPGGSSVSRREIVTPDLEPLHIAAWNGLMDDYVGMAARHVSRATESCVMWDVRACRVCLATDVRLYALLANQLRQHYEVLTGENVRDVAALPHYLCFECSALVHKYYEFRQRCLQGQTALVDLLNTHHQVTLEEISKLDRSRLKSSYVVHHTPPTHFLHLSHEAFEEIKVKEESGTGSGKADNGDAETALPHTDELKEERSDDDYQGYASAVFSSDEDNEPLSLRRTKLDSFLQDQLPALLPDELFPRAKKRKGGKRKRRDEDGRRRRGAEALRAKLEPETEAELEEEKPTLDIKERRKRKPADTIEKIPKKRGPKAGARTKDEADMEEYVSIVKLSVGEQMQEIQNRRTSTNYMNAPYKCDICFKGFVDTEAFRNHVVKHEPSAGDIECPICKFRFQTKRTLQKHAANHEKKYQCKSCPYISKTTTQAKQHQKWHKGITYKCQYCEEVSTKWTSYLSHVRIKHPSEHICNVCGYSFVSKLGLAMHKTMMHKDVQYAERKEEVAAVRGRGGAESAAAAEGGDATPYCVECDVQFTSRQAWKRHMVTSAKHSVNNDFGNSCRVCGESFPTAEELRVHHRKLHARKRPKNYGKKPSDLVWPIKCEHCAEEIPNAREYWTHFRRVHPDKKYPIKKSFVCEICGKEFRGNAFLVYHKRTHFEERSYRCKQCPKSFFNRTNLMMHEKTHSDHRPYPCTVCFKAFKLKGALDRHFRSHTGVKPYECEFCGKAFGQSNSRKLHIRTVHLKQPAPYISKSRLERRRQAESVKTHPPFPY